MPATAAATQGSGPSARGRILRAGAAAALVVALAIVALISGPGRFDAYVADAGLAKHRVLYRDEGVRLVFTDREAARTPYVAEYHGGPGVVRVAATTAARGSRSVVAIASPGAPGRVTVRWLVRGRQRARYVFLLRGVRRP